MQDTLPFEKIKREIIVSKEAETDESLGCYPEKRTVDEIISYGIVNIDKCPGPTSHQVSDYVQKILGITKAGHSGTLDPNVTGVLPTALGRATRIVQTLLIAGKEYVGIMHIHKSVDEATLRKTISEFTGKIMQMPPIKSSVRRRLRERSIYYFEILDIDDKDVLFRVGCEAGTYIRKLFHDIGKKLGCNAHMSELRRTKVAGFDESTAVTLQDLSDAFWYWKNKGDEKFIRRCIQPVETAVKCIPKIWIFDTTVNSLCHGTDLAVPGISKFESGIEKEQVVAVMTLKGEIVCLGTSKMSSKEMKEKSNGIAVRTEKVFMLPDVYPK